MANSFTNCLIADIGGTYTRFAIVDTGRNIVRLQRIENDDYPVLYHALEDYIRELPPELYPDAAAFAVAGPVKNDVIKITNRDWQFSINEYRSSLSLRFLHVINDFAALSLAIPTLEPGDCQKIGHGEAAADKPIGIVGPGTGLGVSFLIPDAGKWIPVSSEGGHVTLAACNEQEEKVISIIRGQHGHVSAERLLSGAGLSILYQAIAAQDGNAVPGIIPNQIIIRDENGTDHIATKTIDMFLEMLGTVAANLALTINAEGGIYFAGGILPRIRDRFVNSGFRRRFINNHRYSIYLDSIPTYLIIKDYAALSGLRNCLLQHYK